jgi:hypothetical protein
MLIAFIKVEKFKLCELHIKVTVQFIEIIYLSRDGTGTGYIPVPGTGV